jgi:hypothetical protein
MRSIIFPSSNIFIFSSAIYYKFRPDQSRNVPKYTTLFSPHIYKFCTFFRTMFTNEKPVFPRDYISARMLSKEARLNFFRDAKMSTARSIHPKIEQSASGFALSTQSTQVHSLKTRSFICTLTQSTNKPL